MAKLVTNTNTALMGTGMNVLAKLVPVSEIKTMPEFSIFTKQGKVVEDITKSMNESGFHNEEPIVIAKLPDGTILGVADGNTRLMVAKEIGLDEVPVVYKTFDSLEDAIQYAKDRQFHRRNLTQAEIYAYANNLEAVEDKNGEGRATERLAEELGISASTIEHARTVENRADEETKEKIKNNKMSINQAYQKVRKSKSKQETDSNDESDSTDFDDDISDALEDNEGNPQSVTVRSRDMSEHFTPPEEDEFDKRLIERYKDGFAAGIKKGFSEGSYQVYDKIITMLHEGKTVEEIENADLFSDFTFSVIAPKLEIATDDEELLKTYNK